MLSKERLQEIALKVLEFLEPRNEAINPFVSLRLKLRRGCMDTDMPRVIFKLSLALLAPVVQLVKSNLITEEEAKDFILEILKAKEVGLK